MKIVKRQATEWRIFSTHTDSAGPLPEYTSYKINNCCKEIKSSQISTKTAVRQIRKKGKKKKGGKT